MHQPGITRYLRPANIAFAAALASCAPQGGFVSRQMPLVDIPIIPSPMHEEKTEIIPGKERLKTTPECVALQPLMDAIRSDCIEGRQFCPDTDIRKVVLPDSNEELLGGRMITQGETILLIEDIGLYLVKGQIRITVDEIDQFGVAFRLDFQTTVDRVALAAGGATPDEKYLFISRNNANSSWQFRENYDGSAEPPDSIFIRSLQPGRLRLKMGPTPDSAIIKYDSVRPCH